MTLQEWIKKVMTPRPDYDEWGDEAYESGKQARRDVERFLQG